MLTDYSIDFIQAMRDLGVETVESDLQATLDETLSLASTFTVPEDPWAADFPLDGAPGILRMTYVWEGGCISSDGRQEEIRSRPDVARALQGESAVYGPCFDKDGQYTIYYSAPILREGRVRGALCVEKDGYRLCELIKSIKFLQSGESYIINADGTDIAVSDQSHIDWVDSGYNGQRILAEKEDPVTRSIVELEQKGLDGETGVGTYQWEGSLCYVAYAPIPSTGWVLLTGLREAEIAAMTRSTFYTSIAKGPTLGLCLAAFLLLITVLIIWMARSMREASQINERLNILANYDPLTSAKNRNSYHDAIDELARGKFHSLGCLYIDANGLHEINNQLGHQAGDAMLEAVADALRSAFPQGELFRIGGDEFVIFCPNQSLAALQKKAALAREDLQKNGYDISIGIDWDGAAPDIQAMINRAEDAMQREKEQYYQKNGKERLARTLDQKLEQIMLEKQDADAFLSVLASEFKGVYFVDLVRDTIRHLFIPSYFEEMLAETGDVFSKAMVLYAQRIVSPSYRQKFLTFCDYTHVEKHLYANTTPEFTYQKLDGSWVVLRIMRFKTFTPQNRETLWIFTDMR